MRKRWLPISRVGIQREIRMFVLGSPIVRPRVASPCLGETLPLIDVVSDELARGTRVIQLQGGPGAGKSQALAWLSAELLQSTGVAFLDDPTTSQVQLSAISQRVICAHREPLGRRICVLRLASWTDDELVEYLQAAAPEYCASVLRRVNASPWKDAIQGNPALWRVVLDAMIADGELSSIRVAIQRHLAAILPERDDRIVAGVFCCAILLKKADKSVASLKLLAETAIDFDRLRRLRHPLVQRIAAGESLAQAVLSEPEGKALGEKLPPILVEELAWLAARDSLLVERLHSIYQRHAIPVEAQAATVLFATDSAWRPDVQCELQLADGQFPRAQWAGLQAARHLAIASDLSRADLSGANLADAKLDGMRAERTNFAGANLSKASLVGARANEANFAGASLVAAEASRINVRHANLRGANCESASLIGAELQQADLTGVKFCHADLTRASLTGAKIENADFAGARLVDANLRFLSLRTVALAGASFAWANLRRCDFEGVQSADLEFEHANLRGAIFTDSVLRRTSFFGADLRDSGLANSDWVGADLRDADLRGVSFHLGSTRSGLVGSPYPGHGSKTGFYTDDYDNQVFQPPEQIRKANLCGADLRGANVEGVDFYLVDLRGARLDDEAIEHVLCSGGILYDRCA
jgi:uncharacterized protein YjbI with pentapeptide repeats